MTQQSNSDPGSLVVKVSRFNKIRHTHTHTQTHTYTHTVGLLCTSDQFVAKTATYTTDKKDN